MSKFTDYQFKPFIREAIGRLGFENPTPIQKEMIPLILKGTNAIGQAHTGTGKSHSFLIPILERTDADKMNCKRSLQHRQENWQPSYLMNLPK